MILICTVCSLHLKFILCDEYRLAGATLLAPVANHWWPGFPSNLSREAYNQQLTQDQWTLRVSHYLPWLTYWWNTQKWFPSSAVIAHSPLLLSPQDLELLAKLDSTRRRPYEVLFAPQNVIESI